MQLKSFAVKGYKNFKQEISLEQMGSICVIHGENNVGKSNVLEAMQLFFQIVGQFLQTPHLKTKQLLEWNSTEIFHLECPNAITFKATLALNSTEIESLKTDTLKRDFYSV
jgi:AAA15 family ATPase/GTPase